MKKIVFAAAISGVLLATTGVSHALDFSDVRTGATLYIDGTYVFDRRVTVIRKDHSDRTVLVRTSSGETKWVRPSDLITREWQEVKSGIQKEAGKKLLQWIFSNNKE